MKWVGLPAKIWMFIFVLFPFLWLFHLSLQVSTRDSAETIFSFFQFQRAFTPPFINLIFSSVLLSLTASLSVLFIALPAVWFVISLPHHKRMIWLAALTIPLGLNFVVRIYAWFVLIRPEGPLTFLLGLLGIDLPLASTQTGVFISLIYGYLPFIFLPLYSVFERLDKKHIEAALDLGANSLHLWLKIIMPTVFPGLIASFIFVFVPMLGEYLIPKMIGGGLLATLGTQIEGQFLGSVRPNWPFGAALSLCLLFCAVFVLAFALRLLKRAQQPNHSVWNLPQTL